MKRLLAAAAGLLLAREAAAWPFEALPDVELPDEITAVEVLPRGGGAALVALGPRMGWILDARTGEPKRLLPAGGVDADVLDLDGDGKAELLLCGREGLQAARWEGEYRVVPLRVDPAPCAAIAVLTTEAGPRIATAGESVRLWRPDGAGGLVEEPAQGIGVSGQALLASQRGYLAAGAVGSSEVLERGPRGDSRLATGGPIGGLAYGERGWAWSLPERDMVADVSHRVVPVAARPGALLSGHLDDDGARDLVVLHPEAGLVGVISGTSGGERTFTVPKGVTSAATGDADGDGCGDVVVAWRGERRLRVLRSTACVGVPRAVTSHVPLRPGSTETVRATPQTPSYGGAEPPDRAGGPSEGDAETPAFAFEDLPPPSDPPPRVLGVELLPFLGEGALLEAERLAHQQYVVLGTGWAIGGTLENTWLEIPFFPALSIELEGGGPHARWFIGGDSAGLFFWVTERPDGRSGGGIHLANATAGVAFGAPRLRAGPFVTAGLYNAGAGVRAVFTPWEESSWELRGIEARLTWFAPSTGQVALYYVWNNPLKSPREGDRLVSVGSPAGPFACSQFAMWAGAAVGISSTQRSWEYVGSDVPVAFSGSPELAVSCDTGKGAGLLLGVETAPLHWFFTQKDDKLYHMGSFTAGPMVGGERFRLGPVATAGVWLLGGGVRASARLFVDDQGLAHRLDVRALALGFGAPSAQVQLLYGLSWDPRR